MSYMSSSTNNSNACLRNYVEETFNVIFVGLNSGQLRNQTFHVSSCLPFMSTDKQDFMVYYLCRRVIIY